MSSLLVPQVTFIRGSVPEPFCAVMAKVVVEKPLKYDSTLMKQFVLEIKSQKGYRSISSKSFAHCLMFEILLSHDLSHEEIYAFQSSLANIILYAIIDIAEEVNIVYEVA